MKIFRIAQGADRYPAHVQQPQTIEGVPVTGEELSSSIMLPAYGQAFTLVGRNDAQVIPAPDAKKIFANTIAELVNKYPQQKLSDLIKRYISRKRDFRIRIGYQPVPRGEIFAIPIFEDNPFHEVKIEFTAILQLAGYRLAEGIDVAERHVENAAARKSPDTQEDVMEKVRAAGHLVRNGVVKIESVGARGTNWDTGYTMIARGLPANELREMISWFANVLNTDLANTRALNNNSPHFKLTMAVEVSALMNSLGLGKEYADAVNAIKDHESSHRRSKENTLTLDINLRDYQDKVKNYLMSSPRLLEILSAAGRTPEQSRTIIETAFYGQPPAHA